MEMGTIVRRRLTNKEEKILAGIRQGASTKELFQYTTQQGLPQLIYTLRSALQPGYKISLIDKRYQLVAPTAEPVSPAQASGGPPSTEAIDPVAYIKDKLSAALNDLRIQHEAKSYEYMQLGEDLQLLDTKIKDLENSLHVLENHIEPYLGQWVPF